MQGRLLWVSQLKAVLQLPESINRDELVLPRVWGVGCFDSSDGLGESFELRPHEDRRRLGPQTYFTPPERVRERVAIVILWAGLGRDFPIHTPRVYGKAGPAERSARRAYL